MIQKLSFVLILTFLTSACSIYHVNSKEVGSTFYAEKASPDEVEYVEKVIRPHEIIGFVTVNTERRQNMDEILAKIKKEAATLGGDAITDITSNATGTWKKLPPKKLLGNAYIRANFTATVVAYQ